MQSESTHQAVEMNYRPMATRSMDVASLLNPTVSPEQKNSAIRATPPQMLLPDVTHLGTSVDPATNLDTQDDISELHAVASELCKMQAAAPMRIPPRGSFPSAPPSIAAGAPVNMTMDTGKVVPPLYVPGMTAVPGMALPLAPNQVVPSEVIPRGTAGLVESGPPPGDRLGAAFQEEWPRNEKSREHVGHLSSPPPIGGGGYVIEKAKGEESASKKEVRTARKASKLGRMQLREELSTRGLSITGLKAMLVARLQLAFDAEAEANTATRATNWSTSAPIPPSLSTARFTSGVKHGREGGNAAWQMQRKDEDEEPREGDDELEHADTASGYVGVGRNGKGWKACVYIGDSNSNRKHHHIGTFATAIAAARARRDFKKPPQVATPLPPPLPDKGGINVNWRWSDRPANGHR